MHFLTDPLQPGLFIQKTHQHKVLTKPNHMYSKRSSVVMLVTWTLGYGLMLLLQLQKTTTKYQKILFLSTQSIGKKAHDCISNHFLISFFFFMYFPSKPKELGCLNSERLIIPHHVSNVTVSCITCHVTRSRCHVSGVRCQVLGVILFFFYFFFTKL